MNPARRKRNPEWLDWLLLAECNTSQSRAEIRGLARRLADAERLRPHWPLIGQLWGHKAKGIYSHFAHYVSASWCGKGKRAYEWQMFERLPRNIGCTPAQQRRALAEVARACRLLERAMKNPAISPVMGDEAMCPPGVDYRRVPLPFVSHDAEQADSVLSCLRKAAETERVVYSAGWVSRPNSRGARETYFVRHLAQVLLYATDSGSAFNSKIEGFLADLVVELSSWEGVVDDYDAARVHECLKVMAKNRPVRSGKENPQHT